MRYKPKSIAALHIALGGLPVKMRVEVDPDIGVSAKTVGELRKVTAWSETLVIVTPQERHPESAVKVSKASVATPSRPNSRASDAYDWGAARRCRLAGKSALRPFRTWE